MKKIFRGLTACLLLSLTLGVMCACTEAPPEGETQRPEYQDPNADLLTFELNFDEAKDSEVFDQNGQSYFVNYVFNDAAFKGNEELNIITRSAVSGGCLPFDGYSNYIEIPADARAEFSGEHFTIDVFVAPRAFEWDAPGAWENGDEHLQVIIGQTDGQNNGFVLGMHKYGDWSFQIGIDGEWYKCNSRIGDELDRYKWNHLTCVFDGEIGYMAIYKNGARVRAVDTPRGEVRFASTPLLIGASNNPERVGMFTLNMYNGLMDELRIYDCAVNEDDVEDYHLSLCDGARNLPEVGFEDVWLDESILDDDIYKPQYHASAPQHWMNEPHALFYYQGNYHLFYQFNPTGPYWRQICWGHWVSPDMVNWRNVKEALVMERGSVAPDGIWSGNAAYRKDGTPVLFFTAGDDSHTENPHSNQNVAIATPVDPSDPDLTEWKMSDSSVALLTYDMGAANEFRDPNVYYEDGTWYMVVSGRLHDGRGTAYLYSTTDDSFLNWTYHGSLLTLNHYPSYFGQTWELVNLTKLTNEAGTVSKYLFALSPAGEGSDNDVYYFLGNFDKNTKKFIPESEEPQLMDYGNNSFTGPTITTLPDGRVVICSIIQGQRSSSDEYRAGWAHTAGVPRQLSLDDAGKLKITPIKELDNLHSGSAATQSQTLTNGNRMSIDTIGGDRDMLHLSLKLTSFRDGEFTVRLKETGDNAAVLRIDKNAGWVSIDTRNVGGNQRVRGEFGGALAIAETFTVDIYIDHAMIEIYLNGQKTITAMAYNTGTGISLGYEGGSVSVESKLWFMKSI